MIRKIAATFHFTTSSPIQAQLDIRTDPYKAIHLTPVAAIDNSHFQDYVGNLLKTNFNSQTSSIWVHLTANNLQLISGLVNQNGFKFHHSKGTDVSLYKWVKNDKKDVVPHYSLHVVSCGGVIVKDNRVLLVQQKSGQLKGYYGFPGGRADPNQGIQSCAEREVREELGLKSQFKRILWIRELSDYLYDSFDMYFACLMGVEQAELKNIKPCPDEVQLTEWVHLADLQTFMKTRSVGTQQHLATYLKSLYDSGYTFSPSCNFKSHRYCSAIDKQEKYFGQHLIAK